MSDSGDARPKQSSTYLIVGIIAATVSAATVAFIFWKRSQALGPNVETVQQLLDRCHSQVKTIEEKLSELQASSAVQPA